MTKVEALVLSVTMVSHQADLARCGLGLFDVLIHTRANPRLKHGRCYPIEDAG